MTRCYICDFDDSHKMGDTNNYICKDVKTGMDICANCVDISVESMLEFGVEDTSEDYRKKHNIRIKEKLFERVGRK